MSLIHDALKRAERDRHNPSGTFVSTEMPGQSPGESRSVWPWLLAITAIPTLAMGGWITWNGASFQVASAPAVTVEDESVSGPGVRTNPEPPIDDASVQPGGEGLDEPLHLASSRGLPTEAPVSDETGADPVVGSRHSTSRPSAASETGRREDPAGEQGAVGDETSAGVPDETGVEKVDEPAKPDQDRAVDDGSRLETPPNSMQAQEEAGKSMASSVSAAVAQAETTESANVVEQTDQVSSSTAGSGKTAVQGGSKEPAASATNETEAVDLRELHGRWRSALANGDMAAADAELAEVRSVLPPEHRMRLRMEAWTAYRRGDSTRAVDRYRQILEASPGDGDAAINLASIYLSRGREARARAVIGEARRYSPESVALKQAQQRIGASR